MAEACWHAPHAASAAAASSVAAHADGACSAAVADDITASCRRIARAPASAPSLHLFGRDRPASESEQAARSRRRVLSRSDLCSAS